MLTSYLQQQLSFLFWFIIFYFREFLNILRRSWKFVGREKFIAGLCLVMLLLSLIPGLVFFKDAASGEFVIPGRHYDSAVGNQLSVAKSTTTKWAIMEELVFASFYYENLRFMRYAIFYLPLAGFIFMALGCLAPANRKILLFLSWGLSLFCIGSPFVDRKSTRLNSSH